MDIAFLRMPLSAKQCKVTMEVPQIDKFGNSIETEFNSVSSATYAVIPYLLGVSPDPGMGLCLV